MYSLAEELLRKETVNLMDIVKVLGERPFPLKESLREYLTELRERQQTAKDDEDGSTTEGASPVSTSTTPTG